MFEKKENFRSRRNSSGCPRPISCLLFRCSIFDLLFRKVEGLMVHVMPQLTRHSLASPSLAFYHIFFSFSSCQIELTTTLLSFTDSFVVEASGLTKSRMNSRGHILFRNWKGKRLSCN